MEQAYHGNRKVWVVAVPFDDEKTARKVEAELMYLSGNNYQMDLLRMKRTVYDQLRNVPLH